MTCPAVFGASLADLPLSRVVWRGVAKGAMCNSYAGKCYLDVCWWRRRRGEDVSVHATSVVDMWEGVRICLAVLKEEDQAE